MVHCQGMRELAVSQGVFKVRAAGLNNNKENFNVIKQLHNFFDGIDNIKQTMYST